MYKVRVMNTCSCFIKNGLWDSQDFSTQEEAKKAAESLLNKMQTTFCSKHEFHMSEQFGSYIIQTKARS